MKLAPGSYQIYSFAAENSNAHVGTIFSPRNPFSIPFTAAANTVTYLGNYQVNGLFNTYTRRESLLRWNNYVDAKDNAGVFFVVSDRQDADIKLVSKRVPNILSMPVINATPDVRRLAKPLFIDVKELENPMSD